MSMELLTKRVCKKSFLNLLPHRGPKSICSWVTFRRAAVTHVGK